MAGQARMPAGDGRGRSTPSDRSRARRPPARLDATSVRVIAQSIPSAVGGGTLREDVAAALASDAEVSLRKLTARARTFMRHARRDTLTAEDVVAALRLRGVPPTSASAALAPVSSVHQACGHLVRGKGVTPTPRFETVDGAPGLYVMPQPMVPLKEIVLGPVPPRSAPPEVHAEWLAFNGAAVVKAAGSASRSSVPSLSDELGNSTEGGSKPKRLPESHVAKRPRALSENLNAIFLQTRTVLTSLTEACSSPPALEELLILLSSTVSIQPLLPALLSLYYTVVASQAHAEGSTAQLIAATRVLRALAANPYFGFEAYVHTALPVLLTTIAGRSLGYGDHLALRTLAVETLRDIFDFHGTPVALARATKTLIATLTADTSELRAVHGAVLGLTALGPEIARIALLPHIPGLLQGLRTIAAAIAEAESSIMLGAAADSAASLDGPGGVSPLSALEAELIASTRADATGLADAVLRAYDRYGIDASSFSEGVADGSLTEPVASELPAVIF